MSDHAECDPDGSCDKCGYPLNPESTYCPECGSEGSYVTDAWPGWVLWVRGRSIFALLCCLSAAIILVLAVGCFWKHHQITSRYPWWDMSATVAMWLYFGCTAALVSAVVAALSIGRSAPQLSRGGQRRAGFAVLSLIVAVCMLLGALVAYPLGQRQSRPLFEAIRLGDVQKARICLARGADPNQRYVGRGLGRIGAPALVTALYRGEDELVVVLLEAGASADFRYHDSYTALMLAAALAEPETVAAFIEHGADVTAVWSDRTVNRIVAEQLGDDAEVVGDSMTALSVARERARYDEAGAEIARMLEAAALTSEPD